MPARAADSAAELASLPLDALLDIEVSGASKFPQRMSEAAASVTVVTAAEIRALGYRTLADVLRSMRGLMVSDDHSYSYLGVRGFFAPGDYNTRVLLLVDGLRTNDNVYDQAYIGDEFPLDLDLVERIEFIPGQGSAVYGANALFGVINVITRKPGAPGTDGAALTLGSGNARQLRLGHATTLDDGTRLQWSASRRLLRGQDLFVPEAVQPGVSDGVARGTDDEQRSSVFVRVQRDELTATALHAERLKGAPITLDTVFGDRRNFNRDEHSVLDLDWQHRLGTQDEVDVRWFLGHYRFDGQWAVDYPPVTLNRDDVTGQWWGFETRWLTRRFAGQTLVVGVEGQQSTHLRQKNYDVETGTVYLDDRRGAHRMGLFAEDALELSPHWSLVAGARWDHNSGYATQLSPRVALLWKPNEALVAKLIHGSAYRPPNAYEAYYQTDAIGGYKLNPQLSAERVSGNELALDWRPAAQQRVSASLYANRARHLLVLTNDPADGLFQFRNLGEVKSRGAELEFEQLWRSGARLRANVSIEDADEAGSPLPIAAYAPRRMAKLAAIAPLPRDWSLGAEWQGIARRGGAAGYGVANLTLSTSLALHGASLSASVRDLLDRRYQDPGPDIDRLPAIAQAGRSWQLRLDWNF
jgi:iron complex outermembrane receptor protein